MASVILEYCYTLVTFSLLIFFIKKSYKLSVFHTHSFKKHIKIWALFGALFGAYSFAWLYTVYPLPWLAPGITQLIGIFLLHCIIIFICALSYSVTAIPFHPYVQKKVSKKFLVLIFALSLTLSELIRSILISLLYSGNGGTIGLHWTASTVGNALSVTPLIEYAYFGGVFALTFIVGIIAYAWGRPTTKKIKYTYSFIIIVIVFFIHILAPIHGPNKPLKIGVITTDYPNPKIGEEKINPFPERFKKIHEMTKSFSTSSGSTPIEPDIIVYPEDTRYVDYLTGLTKIEIMSLYRDTLYIDGTTRQEKQQGKNMLANYSIFYNPNNTGAVGRGKGFIFPFSEYIPSAFTPIFSFFVGKDTFNQYLHTRTYIPRPLKKDGYAFDENIRLSILLCSEILSYTTIQTIKHQNPSILFSQSQLSVFHKRAFAIAQIRSDTKIAAAQMRTPIISSANGFDSFIINPYGTLIESIPIGFHTRMYTITRDTLDTN